MASRTYSAREMTEFARCTLSQLDYYREIQLLSTRQSSPEGAHEYDDLSLLRLQQIRIGRAAGLALEEIRRHLDDAACNRIPTIRPARSRRRPERLRQGAALYVETEAKVQTDADCLAFEREANEVYSTLSALRRSGATPKDERSGRWVERHRCYIDRWFCPCETAEHLAFARSIVRNHYLAAVIEHHGRGLTSFVIAAIAAQTS